MILPMADIVGLFGVLKQQRGMRQFRRRGLIAVGRFALSDHPVLGPFEPFQLVAFLLTHLDSFHPSALRLSRGTFYLAQLGTFHLAATLKKYGLVLGGDGVI